jgi:tetratricopeptide (TPR) repeat protein
LGNLGRTEEALVQRRKAQELDPLSAIINQTVGNTLKTLGRIDEALAQFKAVIEIDPAFPNPYEAIGRTYGEVLGQLDEAVAWHRKAATLDPAQPSSPIYLAMIYLDLGDSARAEFWFNRVQELVPGPYWPYAANEVLHLYRGEKAKAYDFGRELLTLDPGSIYTLAHLRNDDLQAGRFLEARARYERGHPALLLEDEPMIHEGNYVPAIDLALVLTKTGEQERADMLLERALSFLPSPRQRGDGFRISDALIYAQQGKTQAALAALRKAMDQGWRESWWFYFDHDMNLDLIRDEPEFQAMLEEIKADMAAQLARVRAMDEAGQLEPVPDIN